MPGCAARQTKQSKNKQQKGGGSASSGGKSKCKGPEVSRKGKFLGHEVSEAGLREQDQRELVLERWP